MNELQVFKNSNFGEIRVVKVNNEPWFVGKDVAECLGFSNTRDAIINHVHEDDKGVEPIDTPGGKQMMTIINESGLYALIFGSKLPNAKKFKRWVTSEVLPTIRKHGAYMTDNVIEQMLNNPEFGIRLLTELKSEREEKLRLQKEVEYKNEVIKGVTEDIDIYTKRNILNKVVKYKGANFKERWNELYSRFREVYSIDLQARCEGYNLRQEKKKDRLSVVKYAEKFGYIDDLYKIALKLYETDINEILKHLQKIA
jgi:prophage antirepressor-like protein